MVTLHFGLAAAVKARERFVWKSGDGAVRWVLAIAAPLTVIVV